MSEREPFSTEEREVFWPLAEHVDWHASRDACLGGGASEVMRRAANKPSER